MKRICENCAFWIYHDEEDCGECSMFSHEITYYNEECDYWRKGNVKNGKIQN